ncbi:MAG: hypothetical protein ACOCZK_05595, partial [Planctomycetota bacterium]
MVQGMSGLLSADNGMGPSGKTLANGKGIWSVTCQRRRTSQKPKAFVRSPAWPGRAWPGDWPTEAARGQCPSEGQIKETGVCRGETMLKRSSLLSLLIITGCGSQQPPRPAAGSAAGA